MNRIVHVEAGSIAEEMEIEKGDILISINGKEVKDIFDYRYLILDEYLEVIIQKPDGEEWELEIEKEENEDLGIDFENGLMDDAKSCKNKCIFCFIDQMPKGMRETLYFKDDDSRLSFLQGNYVTLTNMSEEDLDRIIFYHLSPINISVHATDIEVRRFMLKNPKSDNLLKYIKKLSDSGIKMNYQIVLCKGVNDGKILDDTITTLGEFIPSALSLSVVPIGLTKFREKLYKAQEFTKEDCITIINQVHNYQKIFKEKYDTKFVFASDEIYLKADIPIPSYESYEDFPQIENGVGMISSLSREFEEEFANYSGGDFKKEISIVTGKLAENFIKILAGKVTEKYPNIKINVFAIENNYFGRSITVSGLITGTDIIDQLKGKALGEYLMIPENALRKDDVVFLDDYSIFDIEKELNTRVKVTKNTGTDFLNNILNMEEQ